MELHRAKVDHLGLEAQQALEHLQVEQPKLHC
jgi:hypothetical protein